MATLNQLISEIAHAAGSPNTLAVRRNIRQAIIHTRNELIRQSYERHGYTDKGLEQRFRLELIDVPDGDIYGTKDLNLPLIKRTKNKVPRPVRLINNIPFQYPRLVTPIRLMDNKIQLEEENPQVKRIFGAIVKKQSIYKD